MNNTQSHLFIAIPIPDFMKQQLSAMCVQMQNDLLRGMTFKKWVFPADYHITLKFLGGVDNDTRARLEPLLRQIAMKTNSFSLTLEGLNTFGKSASPRILWTGVKGDLEPLFIVQNNIDASLASLGFITENRPYTPHLTLAKNYTGNTMFETKILEQAVQYLSQSIPLQWEVNQIVLYQTHLRREPMYDAVEVYTFNE